MLLYVLLGAISALLSIIPYWILNIVVFVKYYCTHDTAHTEIWTVEGGITGYGMDRKSDAQWKAMARLSRIAHDD